MKDETQLMHAPGQLMLAGMPVDLATLDPVKMSALMDLHERWENKQAEKALSNALATFQSDSPVIVKDRTAVGKNNFKIAYASLDDINKAIRKRMDECGLSASFDTTPADRGVKVTCWIRHRDGAKFPTEFTVPTDAAASMNDSQKAGSALTYAKRYALCAALNLIVSDNDDDGHAAGGGASGPGAVDAKQGDHINDLLAKLPFDGKDERPILLNWAGVTSVYDIPASKYDKIVNRLNELISKL